MVLCLLPIFVFVLSIAVAFAAVSPSLLCSAALVFLKSAPISDKIKDNLSVCVTERPGASGWVMENGSLLYVLSATPVPQDEDPELQTSLEVEALNRAFTNAVTHLAIYLNDGQLDRKRFSNRDAANYALRVSFEKNIKGIVQSKSDVVNGIAVSLLWTEQAATLLRYALPGEQFTNNYCAFLYQSARDLFESGDFPGALELFHKIHYMEWANVGAYLGAAVCFLEMGQEEDAGGLAFEMWQILSKDMNTDDMASAAKILYRSGRKDEGFAVMENAYLKIKEPKTSARNGKER